VAKSVKAPIAAWLACVGALVALALLVNGVDAAQRLDAHVLARVVVPERSPTAILANAIVHLGDPLPLLLMAALACTVALWRRAPLDAIAAVTVVAGANLTTQVLKVALAHPRFQPILGENQIGAVAFPSGHATAISSIAIAFTFVAPPSRRAAVAVAGACLVAVVCAAVLTLEWHFPSDVVGGILVSLGWGFAVLAALRLAEGDGSSREDGGSPPPAQPASRAAISAK
jgi:membrane-associated phospholipid phosphatase